MLEEEAEAEAEAMPALPWESRLWSLVSWGGFLRQRGNWLELEGEGL